MQSTLTVTAKGQVTLQRKVRDHLGIKPGDKILVDFLPSGRAEIRAAKPPHSIEKLFGCLAQYGRSPPLSIEEINEVTADGWAGLSAHQHESP